jgi:hypothetical protein
MFVFHSFGMNNYFYTVQQLDTEKSIAFFLINFPNNLGDYTAEGEPPFANCRGPAV